MIKPSIWVDFNEVRDSWLGFFPTISYRRHDISKEKAGGIEKLKKQSRRSYVTMKSKVCVQANKMVLIDVNSYNNQLNFENTTLDLHEPI